MASVDLGDGSFVSKKKVTVNAVDVEILVSCIECVDEFVGEKEYESKIGVSKGVVVELRNRLNNSLLSVEQEGGAGLSGKGPGIPKDTWLAIVTYRGFWDIPRLILVTDYERRFWMLDCVFEEDRDEYSSEFKVYFVGEDLAIACDVLDRHGRGVENYEEKLIFRQPVKNIEFDPASRFRIILRDS